MFFLVYHFRTFPYVAMEHNYNDGIGQATRMMLYATSLGAAQHRGRGVGERVAAARGVLALGGEVIFT
jgi:hypothetical protein